ncbi:MAG: thioredoxin [Dysgonamonadaceae bacterium]|jgi:thioredoxin 1|nr:thioredoxin [Dysgonamonadaceae bacterium]
MALQITDANFEELLNSEKPLIVDFWAEWCGPCRMISPIIDELATAYGEQVNIGKVNVDENDEIVGRYGIRNIPTVLYFKNGAVADKFVGAAQKSVLEDKLKALL